MRILIIEDEQPAARRLIKLLLEIDHSNEILEVLDSIEDAVAWLKIMPAPDLIFLDIELADGKSFEIFKQIEIQSPVVFATAYDQYAIDAFKVNGFDYLLKPIDPKLLSETIDRLILSKNQESRLDFSNLEDLIKVSKAKKEYKERFLIKVGEQLKYVPIDRIAYFYSDSSTPYLQTREGRSYIVDFSLDELNSMLNPKDFFRISRKFIVHHSSISEISTWFNGRLKLSLNPTTKLETLVSRERVKEFKAWLDN
ncbi:MAG: LytTR family DNA-binding domain-containing protein [Salibacteraceae bacterium]|nr:LytTR family DNA-binding domain-containing protein [Salibacteraceae bacterium]|tara:strand:- start:17252 stop:18013 length:762 start_codon:yes stop_codon:yes gene_type:complete